MIRSEDFSFGFTENISKFVILERNIRKVRSLCVRVINNELGFILFFFFILSFKFFLSFCILNLDKSVM